MHPYDVPRIKKSVGNVDVLAEFKCHPLISKQILHKIVGVSWVYHLILMPSST